MAQSTVEGPTMPNQGITLAQKLLRLLCLVGIHDFQTIEVTVGYSDGTSVMTETCQRCGATVKTTKSGGR